MERKRLFYGLHEIKRNGYTIEVLFTGKTFVQPIPNSNSGYRRRVVTATGSPVTDTGRPVEKNLT